MNTTIRPKFVGDVIVYEVAQPWSREAALLKAGSAASIGSVLGKILLAGATAAAKSGNTGNGTIALDPTAPILDGAKTGIYTVRFTTATAFTVENPDGDVIGTGVAGMAFSDDVVFTVTAGTTAFIAGDGFNVTVAAAAMEKYAPLAPAATDGSQHAAAICIDEKIVSTADQLIAIVARGAVVDPTFLVWPVGISASQQTAALATLKALGIIARASI
jgi:hypothetical protein